MPVLHQAFVKGGFRRHKSLCRGRGRGYISGRWRRGGWEPPQAGNGWIRSPGMTRQRSQTRSAQTPGIAEDQRSGFRPVELVTAPGVRRTRKRPGARAIAASVAQVARPGRGPFGRSPFGALPTGSPRVARPFAGRCRQLPPAAQAAAAGTRQWRPVDYLHTQRRRPARGAFFGFRRR